MYDNADDVWGHWSTLFKDILDQHAPIKRKWVRGDQLPWITPQIQREIALRNKLFKRHRKDPSPSSWEAYTKQRNKVTSLKRKGVKTFCYDASTAAKHPGDFWKKMRPLLPNSGANKQSNITLVENGTVITEPSAVADVFNDYFANVVPSGDSSEEVDDFADHPSVKLIEAREVLDSFSFEPVSSSHVRDILDHLNPRKAVGVDGISPRLLRLSAPVLADEIAKLINYLIASGIWPLEWKCGNLTPVFKKAEDTYKGNYHPVSILTALSKVYEKVMYDQMYAAFYCHLSFNLSGFLKNHSCCTALLKMTEDWRRSLDNREVVAAVAVDLSKAFDSINHNLLLAKLKAYGFSASALKLMSS